MIMLQVDNRSIITDHYRSRQSSSIVVESHPSQSTTIDSHRLLSIVIACDQSSPITNSYRSPLAISHPHPRSSRIVINSHCTPLAISHPRSSIVINSHRSPLAIINRDQTSSTVINSHRSPLAIINHDQTSSITIDRHRSVSIFMLLHVS